MCLTRGIAVRQATSQPVHTWRVASLSECGDWQAHYQRVEQYMTTDLVTVHADDVLDLVASIMDWEQVRHVPVEDDEHRLVGLVSYRKLLRLLASRGPGDLDKPIPVSEVMERDVITCSPKTTTTEALDLMRAENVAALLVVKDEKLVGIVTEADFMPIARRLLEEGLRPPDKEAGGEGSD